MNSSLLQSLQTCRQLSNKSLSAGQAGHRWRRKPHRADAAILWAFPVTAVLTSWAASAHFLLSRISWAPKQGMWLLGDKELSITADP